MPYEHLILLNDYLLRVEAGLIDRLIVTMPPRHGKSELISRYLPAWYLGRHPDRQVILVCYGKELAEDHGNAARMLLAEWGPRIFGVTVTDTAAGRWRVDNHTGLMLSRPRRGEITGRGAHLLIVDDPIKDELEAQSELIRERLWTWWQSTASTRLQLMGGSTAAILVQTRWHEDDLAGRLQQTGRWTTLNLPALAEEDDLMGRRPGEALCPELIDLARVGDREGYDEIKAEKGAYFFAAMYQQRPAPAEGVMFKRKDFRYYETAELRVGHYEHLVFVLHTGRTVENEDGSIEEVLERVDASDCVFFQTVDTAMSDDEMADWTVVSTWAATSDRRLLLLDVKRRHFEDQALDTFLMAANDEHDRCRMYVERAVGTGRKPLHALANAGYPVSEVPEEAGTRLKKVARAHVAVAAYERHAVFHPRQALWLSDFEEELVAFPNAKHDDQVDTVSYAARLLPTVGGRPVPTRVEPMVRPQTAGMLNVGF